MSDREVGDGIVAPPNGGHEADWHGGELGFEQFLQPLKEGENLIEKPFTSARLLVWAREALGEAADAG